MEKNIAGDRLLSRSGFTAVQQQSAWKSWVEGSSTWLFEETSLACWPLKFPAEVDKRSQIQWKKSHVITAHGRHGVSHFCQKSVLAANSSANIPLALLFGVKWCKNFLEWISTSVLSHSWCFHLRNEYLFWAFCSFSPARKSGKTMIK